MALVHYYEEWGAELVMCDGPGLISMRAIDVTQTTQLFRMVLLGQTKTRAYTRALFLFNTLGLTVRNSFVSSVNDFLRCGNVGTEGEGCAYVLKWYPGVVILQYIQLGQPSRKDWRSRVGPCNLASSCKTKWNRMCGRKRAEHPTSSKALSAGNVTEWDRG